ncbi:EamA family transporter [Christensenella intestinihominis]|uniref:EamA family transporter n=1 Tax=Christensenella intestinihominis TaxID=1851429 RepID=UPI00083570F0|nr:EamA family transporter [Christensenella intestinihominis]
MGESFAKNKKGIVLMILSSICVCIGQLFWKLSVTDGISFMIVGFAFYAFGALIMLVAYKYGSLSVLQPMLSLNYIFTIFLAAFVLGEVITPMKLAGILVITASVVLIGGGDR